MINKKKYKEELKALSKYLDSRDLTRLEVKLILRSNIDSINTTATLDMLNLTKIKQETIIENIQ